VNTTWILTPLAVIAALYGLERFLRRRSERAWAADLDRRVREGDQRAAEIAWLHALYAMESAEEKP